MVLKPKWWSPRGGYSHSVLTIMLHVSSGTEFQGHVPVFNPKSSMRKNIHFTVNNKIQLVLIGIYSTLCLTEIACPVNFKSEKYNFCYNSKQMWTQLWD